MSQAVLGLILGIVFGAINVGAMHLLKIESNRTVLLGIFADRFAIGTLIGVSNMPTQPWIVGLITGLLVSLSSSILTKSHIQVLVVGILGGIVIGFLVGQFGLK